ncbi:SAM-dependent methyltransferase, partial [Mycolicibacterium farcinogenes]|nr:SAM-dependent methyltransferase [Mycolicibacterium farcinogenes]
KPNEVTEEELRAAVSKYWEIDDIRPAFIHANAVAMPADVPFELPKHGFDEKGRIKFPAFLLTAHKAG